VGRRETRTHRLFVVAKANQIQHATNMGSGASKGAAPASAPATAATPTRADAAAPAQRASASAGASPAAGSAPASGQPAAGGPSKAAQDRVRKARDLAGSGESDEFHNACMAVFQKADKNQDGMLDHAEFMNVLHSKSLNLKLSPEEKEEFLQGANIGEEGGINYAEFVPLVKRLLQRMYQKKTNDWNDWCWVRVVFLFACCPAFRSCLCFLFLLLFYFYELDVLFVLFVCLFVFCLFVFGRFI
jgi:hypothetical protein